MAAVGSLHLVLLHRISNVLFNAKYPGIEKLHIDIIFLMVEPFHSDHLSMLKGQKHELWLSWCLSMYVQRIVSAQCTARLYQHSWTGILRGCNNMLAVHQKMFHVPELLTKVSIGRIFRRLSKLFTTIGRKGMPEGTEHHSEDSLFSFFDLDGPCTRIYGSISNHGYSHSQFWSFERSYFSF